MKHTPRKRFGQNFLNDPEIIAQFISYLAPASKDHLVEIGGGQGALTLPILKLSKQLDVIELDRDLVAILKERSQGSSNLTIYSADALTFDFASLQTDERKLRIFGSLPYNISTPLLFHLFSYDHIISDMQFILQKEVGLRLAAKMNEDHYGRLSVMAQYHADVQLLFDVPARAFYPKPKVTSSVISLIPYRMRPHLAKDYDLFASIVKSAFQLRRKTLRNSLKGILDDSAWAHINIPSDLRAENLSVKDFVEVSNAISIDKEN